MSTNPNTWTKPFHGVTHNGTAGHTNWWATVVDHGEWAELKCWHPGCGFRPTVTHHDNVEQAKAAGEAWLTSNRPRSAAHQSAH